MMAYFLGLLVVLIIFETGYTIGKNQGRYHGKTLRQIRRGSTEKSFNCGARC